MVGLNCLDTDTLMQRLSRTDREIVEQGLAKGVYIEDADEFLAGLGK